MEFAQELHHLLAVFGVQITGRLIGQNQFRIRYYGTGDRHTLLLSSGKLLGEMFGAVHDVHPFHSLFHPLFPFR